MIKRYILLLIGLTGLLSLLAPTTAGSSQPLRPDKDMISNYLKSHPLITGSGANVLEVLIQSEALVIDLSQHILPDGIYKETIFTQLQADMDQALGINLFYMTSFKVEGQPLEYWGRPVPEFDTQRDTPGIQQLPGSGPLSGVKIALSPGHGLYWNETYSEWRYQRIEFFGIREDTVNAEIMRYLQAALLNQGATVIQLRELDFNARTGVTGYPAWHESARRYAIFEGLPSSVYDGSNNNYNSDIRTRPYMANYFGADLFISLHNNGWDGTLRGTETYYDITNHPGSGVFANTIHESIINAIHQDYDPDWIDRHVRATNWTYGEIYYADMPAALIELAFMDNPIDNSYLQDEAFKLLAANAITKGICDYQGVTCDNISVTLPILLETPNLTPAFEGGMCGSGWYELTNQRDQPAYLMLNTNSENQNTHTAEWQIDLPLSGEFRVEAFIPDHGAINWLCPDKTINWDTGNAVYRISHANGNSSTHVNQAPIANDWVDLGIFYFDGSTSANVTLTDLTGEPFQTTTVSASALRFTLVSHADNPIYNTPWVDAAWLTDEANAPISSIRTYFEFIGSCLEYPIQDADGVEIDLSTLIHEASVTYQVNPKLLLALMESEQGALSQCPDAAALSNLLGLDPPSTAREQIATGATMIANAINALDNTGITPNGWQTDISKVTSDGVVVVPASDAITILFDHTPYAGTLWGGNNPDEGGVQAIYDAFINFGLSAPLPTEIFNFYLPILQ
ncbi:MAG: N-acetylmuramoyl-L-alanine amidase [Chloroflexota bacterium]|nr:N-acetylmuramoyl-L-alanine amidase [Chloroflexota bacterium]